MLLFDVGYIWKPDEKVLQRERDEIVLPIYRLKERLLAGVLAKSNEITYKGNVS